MMLAARPAARNLQASTGQHCHADVIRQAHPLAQGLVGLRACLAVRFNPVVIFSTHSSELRLFSHAPM